ncbi:MAG: TetR/AcrR family transcriptional repressor of nem operon [Saprospiraceae bacterium]|jgi:TetR/AcrR family transcriptional repressor of nem operon
MTQKEKLTKATKTRRFIIKEAANLFNQQGYAGTSMQDIMQATGLTKGGLYGNFKSKEEIALASFEFAVEVVKKEVAKRTHVIENTLDKLKGVVYYYKENLFSPPVEGGCPILNTSIEADDNNPVLRGKVIEALDYWQQRIGCTIQIGIERKEVKPNTDIAEFASLFISILEGGIMMARIYKDPKYFVSISKQLLIMIDEIKL